MTIALTPRLIVPASRDAIAFYVAALGATEVSCMSSPKGVVVHAEIEIGGARLMLVDADPEWGNHPPSEVGSPVILCLTCDDPDATCAAAVAHGAEVVYPIADRFYGDRDGRIRDPFGHLWILRRTIREMTVEEIQKGVDDFGL